MKNTILKSLLLTILTVMVIMPSMVFATESPTDQPQIIMADESLELLKSFPADGYHNAQPVNMAVKLWFSGDISAESVQAANKNAIKLTNSSGAAIKHDVIWSQDEPGYAMLLINQQLDSNTEYTVTIDKSLKTADGATLPEIKTFSFKTVDVNASSGQSMIMMLVMVAGMVGLTLYDTRKQAAKEAAKNKDKEKVNPYKDTKNKKK